MAPFRRSLDLRAVAALGAFTSATSHQQQVVWLLRKPPWSLQALPSNVPVFPRSPPTTSGGGQPGGRTPPSCTRGSLACPGLALCVAVSLCCWHAACREPSCARRHLALSQPRLPFSAVVSHVFAAAASASSTPPFPSQVWCGVQKEEPAVDLYYFHNEDEQ